MRKFREVWCSRSTNIQIINLLIDDLKRSINHSASRPRSLRLLCRTFDTWLCTVCTVDPSIIRIYTHMTAVLSKFLFLRNIRKHVSMLQVLNGIQNACVLTRQVNRLDIYIYQHETAGFLVFEKLLPSILRITRIKVENQYYNITVSIVVAML